MAAVLKYSALHMMPFVLSTTQFRVYFCQKMSLLVVHFQLCWLIKAVIGLLKGVAYSGSSPHQYYSGGWQPCQLCRRVLVAFICQYQWDF